jgi:hypothetical protein
MPRWLLMVLFTIAFASQASEERCSRERAPVSNWVAAKVQQSESVFFGTVTFVEPPMPESGEFYDIWTVEVNESYKGTFNGGKLKPANTGWGVLPGESAVFFVDSTGRLLRCSSYQHYLSDFGVVNEVRRVLGSGT